MGNTVDEVFLCLFCLFLNFVCSVLWIFVLIGPIFLWIFVLIGLIFFARWYLSPFIVLLSSLFVYSNFFKLICKELGNQSDYLRFMDQSLNQ